MQEKKSISKAVLNGTYPIPKALEEGSIRVSTCTILLGKVKDEAMLEKIRLYVAVKEKLALLCDFAIIGRNTVEHDAMFEVLKRYKSEIEIDRAVHDLLVGSETIANFFARKGVNL